MVIGKHIKEAEPTDLMPGTAIPFTINIIQKIFLNDVEAEIDAKEEPDKDEEDGDEKPSLLLSKYLVKNTDIFYVS